MHHPVQTRTAGQQRRPHRPIAVGGGARRQDPAPVRDTRLRPPGLLQERRYADADPATGRQNRTGDAVKRYLKSRRIRVIVVVVGVSAVAWAADAAWDIYKVSQMT